MSDGVRPWPERRLDVLKLAASGIAFIAFLVATVWVLALDTPPPGAAGSAAATSAAGAPIPAAAGASSLPPAGLVDRGRALFVAKGCVACHTVAGAGVPVGSRVGPELTELRRVAGTRKPGMAAEAYVAESLREPQAYVVPGYGSGNDPGRPGMPTLPLSQEEVDALVAFLLAPAR